MVGAHMREQNIETSELNWYLVINKHNWISTKTQQITANSIGELQLEKYFL